MTLLRAYEPWIFFAVILSANAACVAAIQAGLMPAGPFSTGRFLILGACLFAVVLLSRGVTGLADLLKPLTVWRVRPGWILFALLWGGIVGCVALVAFWILTGNLPAASDFRPGLPFVPSVFRGILVAAVIGEIVWISYALRRFESSLGAIGAGHLVGIVWALWWLPMMLTNIAVVPDMPVGALFFAQTGVALTCAFVYLSTRSGIAIFILQFSFNSWLLVMPVSPGFGGSEIYWVFAVVNYALALGLLLARQMRV